MWDIPIPLKSPPLSLNDHRMHWAQRAKLTKQLRLIAMTGARSIPDLEKCSVELVWFVNTRHRRDVDNPVPTLKALCDGLVDAEVVPDDTPEYMSKLPVRIVYRPKSEGPACMVLWVEEIVKDEE